MPRRHSRSSSVSSEDSSSEESSPNAAVVRQPAPSLKGGRQTRLNPVATRRTGSAAVTARQASTTTSAAPKRKKPGRKNLFTGSKYRLLEDAIPDLMRARVRKASGADAKAVQRFNDNFLASWVELYGVEDDPHANNDARKHKEGSTEDDEEQDSNDKRSRAGNQSESFREDGEEEDVKGSQGSGDEGPGSKMDVNDKVQKIDKNGNPINTPADRAKKIAKLCKVICHNVITCIQCLPRLDVVFDAMVPVACSNEAPQIPRLQPW
jgi:cobalamin biosynthesis protein CobT